jgi:hypothetical protein
MSQGKLDSAPSPYDHLAGRIWQGDVSRSLKLKWPQEPQEIGSGTIGRDPDFPDCWQIDAITSQGLRKFRQAREIGGDDVQSDESAGSVGASEAWAAYGSFLASCVQIELRPQAIAWLSSALSPRHTRRSDVELQENSVTSAALLSRIASRATTHEERRRAIIEAEVVAFAPDQTGPLNSLLCEFIERFRNSDEQQDLVAVGAAIRKLVATMSRSDLSVLATLLDAEHNVAIPIDVELEVTKTLVRRLSQSPPPEANAEPQLADRLYEIASTYLNPRLLSREKVAAVALNAILTLCLLRSAFVADLRDALGVLRVPWFSDLVARRAVQVRNAVRKRVAPDLADEYTAQLAALSKETASREA